MTVRVIHADCRDALCEIADASIDACVTDPPYALVSIGKRFGSDTAAPCKEGKTGAYARASRGFMGKKWDTGEVAFDPAMWREVLRVLKPGAHLIAFGGTRTYHRLACAIEDGGFEIRDMIAWNYGAGFPKSHDVVKKLQASGLSCQCSKTIVSSHYVSDKNLRDLQAGMDAANALSSHKEQDVRPSVRSAGDQSKGVGAAEDRANDAVRDVRRLSSSTTVSCSAGGCDVLQRFVPIKNVCEPPTADGWKHEGAEGCAEISGEKPGVEGWSHAQTPTRKLQRRSVRKSAGLGSADGAEGPLHHGASTCDGADVRLPSDTVGGRQSRGSQSGEQPSFESDPVSVERGSQAWGGWPVCGGCGKPIVPEGYGTALKPALEPIVLARKPLIGTVAANVLQHGTGALNIDASRVGDEGGTAGAGAGAGAIVFSDGLNGPRGKPVPGLGRWPANVIHDGSDDVVAAFPDSDVGSGSGSGSGGIWSPSTGFPAGRTYGDGRGSAARFFYSAKADAVDRLESKHPTVKPVDLIAYLIRLITPPGGTVLDPFAGSGTLGMACMREGFDAILIEREAEYIADIRRRINHVQGNDTPLFGGSTVSPPPARVVPSTDGSRTKDRPDGIAVMIEKGRSRMTTTNPAPGERVSVLTAEERAGLLARRAV